MLGSHFEIAFGAEHAEAVRLHGAQMRAARKERDIFAGPVHARAEISANGARPGDQKFHFLSCSRNECEGCGNGAALDFSGRRARNSFDDVKLLRGA